MRLKSCTGALKIKVHSLRALCLPVIVFEKERHVSHLSICVFMLKITVLK